MEFDLTQKEFLFSVVELLSHADLPYDIFSSSYQGIKEEEEEVSIIKARVKGHIKYNKKVPLISPSKDKPFRVELGEEDLNEDFCFHLPRGKLSPAEEGFLLKNSLSETEGEMEETTIAENAKEEFLARFHSRFKDGAELLSFDGKVIVSSCTKIRLKRYVATFDYKGKAIVASSLAGKEAPLEIKGLKEIGGRTKEEMEASSTLTEGKLMKSWEKVLGVIAAIFLFSCIPMFINAVTRNDILWILYLALALFAPIYLTILGITLKRRRNRIESERRGFLKQCEETRATQLKALIEELGLLSK